MTIREQINDDELIDVVGGALRWSGGKVYPIDEPTHIYRFTSYRACSDYIKNNWPGGPHDESTLEWLEAAGFVTKAY